MGAGPGSLCFAPKEEVETDSEACSKSTPWTSNSVSSTRDIITDIFHAPLPDDKYLLNIKSSDVTKCSNLWKRLNKKDDNSVTDNIHIYFSEHILFVHFLYIFKEICNSCDKLLNNSIIRIVKLHNKLHKKQKIVLNTSNNEELPNLVNFFWIKNLPKLSNVLTFFFFFGYFSYK